MTEVKTLSSHMTALGKIRADSEDDALNGVIDNLIRELQYAHANSKNKSTPTSLAAGTSSEVQAIIGYCKKAIGTKKPEWQILAERHGWNPPNA
jgi:hypothetical protein